VTRGKISLTSGLLHTGETGPSPTPRGSERLSAIACYARRCFQLVLQRTSRFKMHQNAPFRSFFDGALQPGREVPGSIYVTYHVLGHA